MEAARMFKFRNECTSIISLGKFITYLILKIQSLQYKIAKVGFIFKIYYSIFHSFFSTSNTNVTYFWFSIIYYAIVPTTTTSDFYRIITLTENLMETIMRDITRNYSHAV